MSEHTSFQTIDRDSNDELLITIRRVDDLVYLGLSLRTDGDVEVGLDRPAARKLIALLSDAVMSD